MEGGASEKSGEGKGSGEAAQTPGSLPTGREWVQHLCDESWSQPRHSPRARGSQGPKAATRGPQALGQPASQASWPPSHALRRSPLQKPRALHAFLSAERGETREQGVDSDGEPLPRPRASPASWGHVSRPPRPRANRWGGGARLMLPGTAPLPRGKSRCLWPNCEKSDPYQQHTLYTVWPPRPQSSAPPHTWNTGALTSWGSPLPSPVSQPPPPGGCPLGSCPTIRFITASYHLEFWVTTLCYCILVPYQDIFQQ